MERRMVEDGSMLADGLSSAGAPPPVYESGRVCIEPECTVRLSRYNSTDWCALHESPLSTDRPFDTSVRQRGGGRRRNSSGRRRTRNRREAA
ncbi:MAG: hypothetical protein JO368_11210 [Acidimicrobiales bacterium]|nr:hypothetical protein [Acidimicrobiales bacterium]